ncbi:AIF_collapsed_G0010900.mRNA.1.CDS.1 [Saccharomyces cerevisiae]|nr:AIF_collapsed_G0010900.mRNA.1.CDS.1 [Saccharomyces cerevisiae]
MTSLPLIPSFYIQNIAFISFNVGLTPVILIVGCDIPKSSDVLEVLNDERYMSRSLMNLSC